MQVVYVSRSEIMDLEKARLEQEQDPEGRMFFGKYNGLKNQDKKIISLVGNFVKN